MRKNNKVYGLEFRVNSLTKSTSRHRSERNNPSTGFTFAEVLITLGIIGVVAALTMPALIAKHKEKETVVKLKKVYSVLINAFRLAVNEQGGTVDGWGLVHFQPQKFVDILTPYLNVVKNCGTQTEGCFASGSNAYKSLTGENAGFADIGISFARFVLDDGVSVAVWMQPETVFYGFLLVDLNGKKPPNTNGKDVFWFEILNESIMPAGLPDVTIYTFSNDCNLTKTGNYYNGRGCTAWVIYNENLDYLHCSDLSWNGRTKCN